MPSYHRKIQLACAKALGYAWYDIKFIGQEKFLESTSTFFYEKPIFLSPKDKEIYLISKNWELTLASSEGNYGLANVENFTTDLNQSEVLRASLTTDDQRGKFCQSLGSVFFGKKIYPRPWRLLNASALDIAIAYLMTVDSWNPAFLVDD